MTPDSMETIADIYRRYKTETNSFIDWLARKAHSTGLINDLIPHAARIKDDNATQVHQIAVKDLNRLAKAIHKSALQVPSAIIEKLANVISWRKQCTEWYKANACSDDSSVAQSTKGHMHFVLVLEVLRRILKPLVPPQELSSSVKARLEVSNDIVPPNAAHITDELQHPTDSHTSESNPEDNDSKHEYVLEAVAEDEPLACHFFGRECLNVTKAIADAWLAYGKGERSLVSTSLIINYGIAQIRILNDELDKAFPSISPYREQLTEVLQHYIDIHIARVMLAAKRGTHESCGKKILEKLEDYSLPRYLECLQYRPASRDSTVLTTPVTHRTFDYAAIIHLEQRYDWTLHHVLEWIRGFHEEAQSFEPPPEPTTEWMPPDQEKQSFGKRKFHHEKRALYILAVYAYVVYHRAHETFEKKSVEHLCSSSMPNPWIRLMRQNELIRAMISILHDEQVSAWTCVAIGAFWDAYLATENMQIDTGLRHTRYTASWMKESIATHLSFMENHTDVDVDAHRQYWWEGPEQRLFMLTNVGKAEGIAQVHDTARGRNKPWSPMLLSRNSPFMCGIQLLESLAQFHRLSAELTFNGYDLIYSCLHFYNAFRQSRLLEVDFVWHDLEYIIEAQKEQHVFHGPRPEDAKDCARRMHLSAGLRIVSCDKTERSKRGKRKLKSMSRFFKETLAYFDALKVCEQMVNKHVEQLPKPSADATLDVCGKMQILSDLLRHKEVMLNFDLLALHARCAQLLEQISIMLSQKWPQHYAPATSNEQFDANFTLHPMRMLRLAGESTFASAPGFLETCESMKVVIEKAGNREITAAKNQLVPEIDDNEAFDQMYTNAKPPAGFRDIEADLEMTYKDGLKYRHRRAKRAAKKARISEEKVTGIEKKVDAKV